MFRYDDRAFLVQLRRAGMGTRILDAETRRRETTALAGLVNQIPWVLHAASTDLPCLLSMGWRPNELHDTQIGGQLLGVRHLGLGPMLEEFLHVSLAKDKGQSDWSRRPLTRDLLSYAALDVELLLELHAMITDELHELGRYEWYRQECEHMVRTAKPLTPQTWDQMKGLSRITDARGVSLAKALWQVREEIARANDYSPEAVLRTKEIITILSGDRRDLFSSLSAALRRSRRRLRPTDRDLFFDAVRQVCSARPGELETVPPRQRGLGIPDHRRWPEHYPEAQEVFDIITEAVEDLAAHLDLQDSVLITVSKQRLLAWEVSQAEEQDRVKTLDDYEELIGGVLEVEDFRPWQIEQLLNAVVPRLLD